MAREVILTGLLLLATACPAVAAELERARYVMGTLLRVRLTGADAPALEAAAESAFAEVDRWDRLLSTYKPDSEVSRANAAAPGTVAISSDTLRAVQSALVWTDRTGGAFDVTVGPLTALWGFQGGASRVPEDGEIAAARSLMGRTGVELDLSVPSVRLAKKGMALDFGGIGKGWALDRARELLEADASVEEVVLDFGGQLLFWSRAPRRWPAAVRHPLKEGETLGRFETPGTGSLSTSAQSGHFFTASDPKSLSGGRPRRYGHILDPRTGRPVEGMESVTVWADTGEAADALSTALFVMGPNDGGRYATEHEVSALFIFTAQERGLASRATPRWKELFGQEGGWTR